MTSSKSTNKKRFQLYGSKMYMKELQQPYIELRNQEMDHDTQEIFALGRILYELPSKNKIRQQKKTKIEQKNYVTA